jgi:diadenosine tetraphosphatase ApaH/serine/threonine PP2A family protein phosphatase
LAQQAEEAQLWIREPFLSSSDDFGAVVVHGHTPVPRVEVRPNRIGIDTGAVFGGALACLVLEGAEAGLLVGPWIEPLPALGSGESPHDDEPGRGRGVLSRVFGGQLFGRRG